MSSRQQRYALKFSFKLGIFDLETFELIKQAYGDDALSSTRVFEWRKMFKEYRELVSSTATDARRSLESMLRWPK